MTKMLIDIDEKTLAAAQEVLGTSTKKETVNRALAEVEARAARAQARIRLAAMVDDGAIDLDLLSDKANYRPRPDEKRGGTTTSRSTKSPATKSPAKKKTTTRRRRAA